MRHELTEQELSAGRKKGSSPKSRKKAEETRQKTILIKKAVDDAIRTLLTEENGDKGKPYFVDFLSNFLLAAKRFPNSQAGLFMAERLVPKDTLTELDSADEKDALRDIAFQRYRLLEDFFREQRDVILDTNHQKKLIACCSRPCFRRDSLRVARPWKQNHLRQPHFHERNQPNLEERHRAQRQNRGVDKDIFQKRGND